MADLTKKQKRLQEKRDRVAFQRAAWEQRSCAVTDDARDFDENGRKNWEAHHVVEARWLRARGHFLWDPRNSLRLRPDVHAAHTSRMKPIPMSCLTDENIEYAFELMGVVAIDYLERLYAGTDPRFQRASEVAEEEWEAEVEDQQQQAQLQQPE